MKIDTVDQTHTVTFESGRVFTGSSAELVRLINRLGRTPAEDDDNEGVKYGEWSGLISFVTHEGIAEEYDGDSDEDYVVRML